MAGVAQRRTKKSDAGQDKRRWRLALCALSRFRRSAASWIGFPAQASVNLESRRLPPGLSLPGPAVRGVTTASSAVRRRRSSAPGPVAEPGCSRPPRLTTPHLDLTRAGMVAAVTATCKQVGAVYRRPPRGLVRRSRKGTGRRFNHSATGQRIAFTLPPCYEVMRPDHAGVRLYVARD